MTEPFAVILADCPWPYAFSRSRSRSPDRHYPSMTLQDLRGLGRMIRNRAADDAVLFLWATAPKLEDALGVMAAWGFNYRTNGVWHKIGGSPGMGHYDRIDHEHILLGIRGSPGTPKPSVRESSVLRAPAGPHSAKPTEIHGRIERYYPNARRLELFARYERPGWTALGNEIDGRDIREALRRTW